jgi:hypothetical protein
LGPEGEKGLPEVERVTIEAEALQGDQLVMGL